MINMGLKSSVLMQIYFFCMSNDLTAKEKPSEKLSFKKWYIWNDFAIAVSKVLMI